MTADTRENNCNDAVECAHCGEKLTAPAWSENTNKEQVRRFWFCSSCGFMFESLDHIDPEESLPAELAEKFWSNLLVA